MADTMNVRSKNSEQSYEPKSITFLTSGFRFGFCLFRFSFPACCLLTFLAKEGFSTEQPYPNNPAAVLRHLTETSPDANAPSLSVASENLNSELGRELWRARVGVVEAKRDQTSKNKLKQLIEQVRSVEFEPQKQSPEPITAIEPMPTTKPNETLNVTDAPNKPPEKETESKLPYRTISNKTLRIVESLSQHPDQLENPFELGEVLFLSENVKEAAILYQEALNRKSADDARSAEDRAWLLFQIGNCLRNDDPLTAKKMYRQLITQYPDSQWTDLAKAQDKLIDWYQKDKPRTLVGDHILHPRQ
jgi:tetratricopeptide (TPR) repeat protein